ncbi:hypothetical protein [Streptomyces diastatochromogenes]|uniref:Uncharacterized protein n=1 Tax=Streptomyces diastatochromogenes TaxID=42236 RepID=A0A233SPU0_STRDA|nr:hypothetical protein [Streptomyces diastatochromogenes]OXY97670.1 hypothetical protein BEK98_08955 [Streptomyces diastatochromogenes]
MQWTNGNGGAYGEDPYGGAGYAYAYGHDGYGHDGYGHEGYAVDTATLTGDPVQLAQWTQPHSTAWDAAHGDVLTVPAAEIDTQPTPFVQPESESDPVRPVFVDSSGRRQRLVLRAARLLVIPAGGYVALLISTMLGGPGISAPFVPQPDSAHGAGPGVTASDSPSSTGHSAGSASSAAAHGKSRSTAQRTSGQPVRPTASTAPAATSGPTAAPTRATSPTATVGPTSTPSSRGRALGTSHKPVK